MTEPVQAKRIPHIVQFTILIENKVGRLNDLVMLLANNHLHLIALSVLDTTDTVSVRLVVNYSDQAREVLHANGYPFRESEVVAVEIENEQELKHVTCSLVQAEINLYYIYAFLMRPGGKTGLVVRCEDPDLAEEILRKNRITVLSEADIAR
jgi:hypothetical protein